MYINVALYVIVEMNFLKKKISLELKQMILMININRFQADEKIKAHKNSTKDNKHD